MIFSGMEPHAKDFEVTVTKTACLILQDNDRVEHFNIKSVFYLTC